MNVLSSVFSMRLSASAFVSVSALRRPLSLRACGLLLAATLSLLLFSACSGDNQGNSNGNGSGAPPPPVELAQLHWCDKPFVVFSDQKNASSANPSASSTPAIVPPLDTTPGTATTNAPVLTNWQKVKPLLNFTTYLPATLQDGACLVSVTGTVHDPIFGSSFTISYLMPDHSSINVAEAPLRAQDPVFQCSVSTSTPAKTKATAGTQRGASSQLQLCSGAHDKTSITFSAQGTNDFMKQFYNNLQANVNWVPASSR